MNDVDIKTREYTTVSEVAGPLMVVQGVEGAAYNEIVEIETPAGENRTGQVLEVKEDIAVVQVFEGTSDLNTESTKFVSLEKPQKSVYQQICLEEFSMV